MNTIKRIAITTVLLAFAGAIASCEQERTQGNTQTGDYKYYCGQSADGVPTTFVKSDRGDLALLRWESDYFKKFGYTREQRCQAVSQKFQQVDEKGLLDYVTIDEINNLPVICASSSLGGGCEEALFTLQPDRNAAVALEEMFAGTVQEQNGVPYIELQEAIDQLGS